MQAARWYRAWCSVDPANGRILVGQQTLDGAGPTTCRGAFARTDPAVRRCRAARGGKRRGTSGTFHRQARGSGDPARLRASWRDPGATLRGVGAGTACRLGFFVRHRQPVDLRYRPTGLPRRTGEPADARRGRHAVERARTMLAPRTARLRRHPFPCRRPGRLRLAGGFHLDRAGRSAERRLRAASDLPHPARTGCRSMCCRGAQVPFAPIVFLASTFTYQAYANHARSSLDQAITTVSPPGAPIRTIPTSIRSTAARPTTSIATAAAFPSRHATGRS